MRSSESALHPAERAQATPSSRRSGSVGSKGLAVIRFQARELREIDELQSVDVEHLAATARDIAPLGFGTEEPMEAGFEGVGATAPAHGQAARHVVHFKYLGLVAAFLCVHGGAKTRDAAADDDDLPVIPCHRHVLAPENRGQSTDCAVIAATGSVEKNYSAVKFYGRGFAEGAAPSAARICSASWLTLPAPSVSIMSPCLEAATAPPHGGGKSGANSTRGP